MKMSGSDPRMVHGAAIADSMHFDVRDPKVRTRGPLADAGNDGIVFEHCLACIDAVRLESRASALSELKGELTIRSAVDGQPRSGISREKSGYWIDIVMAQPEFEVAYELFNAGFRITQLTLEFEVEYEQWFSAEGYWDDVRYSWVECRTYQLEWTPTAEARPKNS